MMVPRPASSAEKKDYDAILIVGFGGPEKREDVLPFLENVTAGPERPPRAAAGGRRALRSLRRRQPDQRPGPRPDRRPPAGAAIGTASPCRSTGATATGTRCWPTRCGEMAGAGVKRALAVVLAAYSSYSSCRQYREDIERARDEVGPRRPAVDKIAGLLQPPRLHRRQRRPRPRGPRPSPRRPPRSRSTWRSPPTASRSSMAANCQLRDAAQGDLPAGRRASSASGPTAGRSSTRAGAAGRRTPGSSPTSSIICAT